MSGILLASQLLGAQTADPANSAAEIWERAILAKGGRERLVKIQNLLVSTHHPALDGGVHGAETLFVFPNRYWLWHDHRPPANDYATQMYNLDQTVCWSVRAAQNTQSRCPPDLAAIADPPQLAYLLETSWIRPRPIRTWHAELEQGGGNVPLVIRFLRPELHRHQIEIVSAVWKTWTIDYYLDSHSYLPLRVLVTQSKSDGVPIALKAATGELQLHVGDYSYRFSDYEPIDGLLLPTKECTGPGTWDRVSCRINVTYDEQLFQTKPNLEEGPNRWKQVAR